MDSTELRLVLLVAGIVLIFGIYAWEKHKRRARNPPRRSGRKRRRWIRQPAGFKRREPTAKALWADEGADDLGSDERKEPTVGLSWPDEEAAEPSRSEDRREPYVAAAVQPEPEMEPEPPPSEPPTVDDWLEAKSHPSPADEVTPEWTPRPDVEEPALSSPSAPDAKPLPPVLVIHVASRVGGSMSGDLIMSVARDLALEPGDMDILHRHDEATDKVIFSVASMVEPGTFPFSTMSAFSTPGLVLFAQLPGVRPAIDTYDHMLEAAERLSALLDGRMLDEKHRPLTREARRRMRDDLGAGVLME